MYLQATGPDITHQSREAFAPGPQLVLDLHQRADRHDADLRCCVDELATAIVIRVAAIHQRDQRPCIENQRQASGRYSRRRAAPRLATAPVEMSGSRVPAASLPAPFSGGVAERLNAPVLKTGMGS